MKLKKLVVLVSYRIDAGLAHTPNWKALRARVVQEDASGQTYGTDLTRQGITNLDMLVSSALVALRDSAEEYEFRFDEMLNQGTRVYSDRGFLRYVVNESNGPTESVRRTSLHRTV